MPIVPIAPSDGLYGAPSLWYLVDRRGADYGRRRTALVRRTGHVNYVLRLGARLTGLGSILAAALVAASATWTARREDATPQFNRLTLSRVDNGSNWLVWVALGC